MQSESNPINRKNMYLKISIIFIIISVIGCELNRNGLIEDYAVTASGIIKKQGMTGYMYGTHVLKNDNGITLYALRSNNIDLDDYIDLKETVKGDLIDGYPVDGGPDYLDVKLIYYPPLQLGLKEKIKVDIFKTMRVLILLTGKSYLSARNG
ncbi:hypothetical protein MUP95_05555 [bacterium]|nr:hypothetical protein [bacterium]